MERQPRKRKRGQQTANNAKVKAPEDSTSVAADEDLLTNSRAVIPDQLILPPGNVGPTPDADDSVADKGVPLVNETPKTASLSRASQSATSSSGKEKSKSSHHRSPSPARYYRQREQSELKNLNDRLFSHVDNVKQLQSENARLKLQMHGMEVISQEMKAMKHLHGNDIGRLQEQLDAARQENNRLEQSLKTMSQERDNFRDALAEKTEEIISLEKSMESLYIVSQKYDEQQDELKMLKETLQEKEADVTRMSDDLVKAKVANKRLEEDAQRNRTLYMQEIEKASTRINQHFESYDQRLEAGYEKMVNEELGSVRDQHIRELADLKEELTTLYQTKLVEWKTKAERANADLLATKKELKASKTEQENLRSQTIRFKMDAAAIKVQLEEEQTKYQDLTKESERERCQLQREMVMLKQELSEVSEELEEVGGANMRLEQEISTYRVILDDLERKNPLCSSTRRSKKCPPSENASPSSQLANSEDTDGNKDMMGTRSDSDEYLRTNEVSHGIHIDEVDPSGRYISLVNKADHLVDLCLWTLNQSVSPQNSVQFELPFSTPLATDQRLTIWSQGEGPFEDKASSDAILSLADPRSPRDVLFPEGFSAGLGAASANNSHSLPDVGKSYTDILHINMLGKRWLPSPHTMNVRLQDGDGQLQAKCDLTSLEQGHNQVELAGQPEARPRAIGRKLANMFPFYSNNNDATVSFNDGCDKTISLVCGRGRGGGTYMQNYKRKRVTRRVRDASVVRFEDGDQHEPMVMNKDGCLAM